MRKYWSHAAMLLLGATLVVGFYEGRRLVRNTVRALTAATQISTAATRHGSQDQAREALLDKLDEVRAARSDDGHKAGKRRQGKKNRDIEPANDLVDRTEQIAALRVRQRQRLGGAPVRLAPSAPGAKRLAPVGSQPLAIPVGELKGQVGDTGEEAR